MADDFSFSIEKQFGVISTNAKTGWSLELNRISWSGRPSKFDIRSWNSDHTKMGKGITLSDDELFSLKGLLNQIADI